MTATKTHPRANVHCDENGETCQNVASFAVWFKKPSAAGAYETRRFACSRCLAAVCADAIREGQEGVARVYLIGWTP